MGVMITAPANNFERHMLPVAFATRIRGADVSARVFG